MLPVSRAGASKSDSQEWTLFDLPLARGKHPGHCKRSILRIEAISLRNEAVRMPLYWLCYHRDNQISVVIGPAARSRRQPASDAAGPFLNGGKRSNEKPSSKDAACISRQSQPQPSNQMSQTFS